MEISFDADLTLLMRCFLGLIGIDFFLGVAAAGKEGRIKSRVCSNGMFRSIGELAVLGLFMIINMAIPNIHDYLFMFICLFILKELISVAENLQRLGVWIPPFIAKMLPVIEEKLDNGELTVNPKKK